MAPQRVESPLAACKMVTADGTPLVETCVLLPAEFALKVETQPRVASFLHLLPQLAPRSHLSRPLLDHLGPPPFPVPPHLGPLGPALNPLGAPLNRLTIPPAEDCIQVCATRHLPPHTRYLPFSGTVRTDNLPLVPSLPPMDVSIPYGFLISLLHSHFVLLVPSISNSFLFCLCLSMKFVQYSLSSPYLVCDEIAKPFSFPLTQSVTKETSCSLCCTLQQMVCNSFILLRSQLLRLK